MSEGVQRLLIPIESVQNLRRISAVVPSGDYYSREDLDALLDRVRTDLKAR